MSRLMGWLTVFVIAVLASTTLSLGDHWPQQAKLWMSWPYWPAHGAEAALVCLNEEAPGSEYSIGAIYDFNGGYMAMNTASKGFGPITFQSVRAAKTYLSEQLKDIDCRSFNSQTHHTTYAADQPSGSTLRKGS